jgi:cell filamentation protein
MSPAEKYAAADDDFDAEHGILKNRAGLTDPAALDRAETRANQAGFADLILHYSETHRFDDSDVRFIHRALFQDVFTWAGTYRRVDIASADIRWCHAQFIGSEMKRFGRMLAELSPLSPNLPYDDIIHRLARVHGELVVIHPFRDGNGRTTRTLVNLLLLQADYEPVGQPLFYSKDIRPLYHRAIREIWAEVDYRRLETLLRYLIPPKA